MFGVHIKLLKLDSSQGKLGPIGLIILNVGVSLHVGQIYKEQKLIYLCHTKQPILGD